MRLKQRAAVVVSALLFCLGSLFPAGFTSAALAAPYGSSKGTPFQQGCGSGALIGVGYWLGKGAMNSIAAICSVLENGTPSGDPVVMDEIGPPGSDGRYESKCPDDMVVMSITVYLGANDRVHHLRLNCHVANGENKMGVLVKPTRSPGGDPETSHRVVGCPSDQDKYANGLTGTTEFFVNSLGIVCAAAEADISGGDDKPSKPGQMTANDDTTIYAKPAGKEIGYISKGDVVTVKSCEDNGDGWCAITKPKKGFVWGGDLD